MLNETGESRGAGEGRREAKTLMKETVTDAGEEKVMHDAHIHHMHLQNRFCRPVAPHSLLR